MFDFMKQGAVDDKDVQKAIKELPLPQKIKCVAIYKRYKQILKVEEEMKEACKVVEKKHLKLDEPVLKATSEIVSGKRSILAEEVKEPETYLQPEEIEKIGDNLGAKKIEAYWSRCLSQSKIIKETIGNDDEELLKHIQNIRVQDDEGSDDFTIIFDFSENEYIKNEKLAKKFFLKNDMAVKSESTKIEWKGKNLCMKEIKKKQKNKKTGQHRVVNKTVEAKSFFNFFRDLECNAEVNPMEATEQELKAQEQLDHDFQIGGIIVDEIMPYSLEYYFEIPHEEDGDDFGDDEDEDDFDQEDDEPKKGKNKNKGGNKSGDKSKSKSKSKGKKDTTASKAATEEKPECKQQ